MEAKTVSLALQGVRGPKDWVAERRFSKEASVLGDVSLR